jgi:hypothetical protein
MSYFRIIDKNSFFQNEKLHVPFWLFNKSSVDLRSSSGPQRFDAQTPPGTLKTSPITRDPLSAKRPNLGCSLPSLAGFAW